MRHFDQAAVFTDCCLEYGVIRRNKETGKQFVYCLLLLLFVIDCCLFIVIVCLFSIAPLIEAVFLEYARFLDNLGLTRGMRYYCNLAGTKGSKLLEDHLSPQKTKPN